MLWISGIWIWIPLYVGLVIYIKHHQPQNWGFVLLFACILVSLTDQISVHLFKEVFLRYRPSHNLVLRSRLHLVNDYAGGLYGFISSHAANTFGIAAYIGLVCRTYQPQLRKWLFAWASLVSLSRIYLGVHYPSDVVVGAIVGILLGFMIFYLTSSKTTISQFPDKH